MRVLVAVRPRAYRDALAQAIKRVRRLVAVNFLDPDPDILDYEIRYLEPQVIICDRSTSTVREYATGWVEMSPCDHRQVVVSIGGQAEMVPDISLDELISIIDRAEVSARTGGH